MPGAVGLAGWSFPGVEMAIVVSVIALGIAVAGAIGNAAVCVPLVFVAGLAHGNAHGEEAPSAANPLLYVAGFLAATMLLHAAGLLGGTVVRRNAGVRVTIGATFIAAGVMLFL